MALRFTIRSSDLKRLRNALDKNPCPEKGKCWLMSLEISPCIAEFSFGEQRIQYPIDGKSTGYARFPDWVIWRVTRPFLDRRPPAELQVSIGHGWMHSGSESVSDSGIEVGYVRYAAGWGYVYYTSDAELMALGQMLEDPTVLHPELPQHIKEAGENIMGSVYRAAAELRKRGVMEDEVEAQVYIEVLVHEKLEVLKPALRQRFDTLKMKLWKS